MHGDITRSKFFNRMNVNEAFACVLMPNREKLTSREVDENVDSKTLLTYLKIESHVPSKVSFSVELICKENMSVLNSTLMQRAGYVPSGNMLGSLQSERDLNVRTFDRRDIFNASAGRYKLQQYSTFDDEFDEDDFEMSSYTATIERNSEASVSMGRSALELKTSNDKLGVASVGGKGCVHVADAKARSPQVRADKRRSSQLWQGSAKPRLDRKSFATNTNVAGKTANFALSILPKKMLLKTDRRTVSHKSKLVAYDEYGEKVDLNTVSSAFQSMYGDNNDVVKSQKNPFSGDKKDITMFSMKKWYDYTSCCTCMSGEKIWKRWCCCWHGSSKYLYDTNEFSTPNEELESETNGKESMNVAKVEDIPSLVYLQSKSREKLGINDSFWDASASHYVLPVFASGRAYVPSAFDSLLVQSFFGGLAPMICELFVSGQNHQAVLQVDIPKFFHDKTFSDLITFFISHRVRWVID